jgi:hypothetical protein
LAWRLLAEGITFPGEIISRSDYFPRGYFQKGLPTMKITWRRD